MSLTSRQGTVKQSQGVIPAGSSKRIAPFNPKRVRLDIQCTGSNNLLVRFGGRVQYDNGDFVITPGNTFSWHDPVSINSVDLGCNDEGGTAACFIEYNEFSGEG